MSAAGNLHPKSFKFSVVVLIFFFSDIDVTFGLVDRGRYGDFHSAFPTVTALTPWDPASC